MFAEAPRLVAGECGRAGYLRGVNVCTLAAASQPSAGREKVSWQLHARSLSFPFMSLFIGTAFIFFINCKNDSAFYVVFLHLLLGILLSFQRKHVGLC